MAILFKVVQSTIANKKGRKYYYPRVIYSEKIGTNQVAEEIALMSSLSTGDVKNVLDNLSVVFKKNIMDGNCITLDGIGTFYASLKSRKGQSFENPQDVMPSKSNLTIRFNPLTKRTPEGRIASRSIVGAPKFKLHIPIDRETGKPKISKKKKTEDVGGGTSGGDDL